MPRSVEARVTSHYSYEYAWLNDSKRDSSAIVTSLASTVVMRSITHWSTQG